MRRRDECGKGIRQRRIPEPPNPCRRTQCRTLTNLNDAQISRNGLEPSAASRKNLGRAPDGASDLDLSWLDQRNQRAVADLPHQNHIGCRSLRKRGFRKCEKSGSGGALEEIQVVGSGVNRCIL